MPAGHLTAEAMHENANALAAALGIQLEQAAEALDLRILITADPADEVAQDIAREVTSLLSRTVRHVSMSETEEAAAAELIIGTHAPRTGAAAHVYVQVCADRVLIGRSVRPIARCAEIPKILRGLIACYACAASLYHALGGALAFGMPEPLIIEFAQLGVEPSLLAQPVELGRAYLAGAGAIGNGLLWGARHLDLRGQLDVVDDDRVSSGNLNRQVWFETDDIDELKVERLVARAQPVFPRLTLVPRPVRLQALAEKTEGPWLERLIVAVDSRRARRALQNECPGEVFDASTTDIREIVVHYNRQPAEGACLSCIYEPDAEEVSREQHIAEHLGVSLDEVRTERISANCAQVIAQRFSGLIATSLEGTAYDSLFKRLCAEGALRTLAGKRVIAPFAFVSALAGTLLALELVRRLAAGVAHRDNYWRLSPWHAPLARRRVCRPKQPGCAFCGSALIQSVNKSLWRRR